MRSDLSLSIVSDLNGIFRMNLKSAFDSEHRSDYYLKSVAVQGYDRPPTRVIGRKMIDACAPLRCFGPNLAKHSVSAPLLHWVEEWFLAAGRGVVAGVIDSDFDGRIPDLAGADLVIRDFAGSEKRHPQLAEHGTYSVALLVGQGCHQFRGIAPHAHLCVAKVAGADGVATRRRVAEAIEWIVSSGARIIVIPLGDPTEGPGISRLIERASKDGVVFFAAAGNGHPNPMLFPARHPLTIAVGAADRYGNLLPWCSRRPRLDLVAPGWQIPGPIRGRVIRRRTGTSVACIIAAGVAMLALAAGASPVAGSMWRMDLLTTLRGGSG